MKTISIGNDPLAKALEKFYETHTQHIADVQAAEKAVERSQESGRVSQQAWNDVQTLRRDTKNEAVVLPIKPQQTWAPEPVKVLPVEKRSLVSRLVMP